MLTAELKRSRKFINWRPVPVVGIGADEQHFTPAQLAKQWAMSVDTIRRIFEDETGVLKYTNSTNRKRVYVTMRIPLSVAIRVHRRLTDA